MAAIGQGAHIGAATLWYDKPHKQFYLLVSLEVEVADPTPESHTEVVGIDVGQRYLAVVATPTMTHAFIPARRSGPKPTTTADCENGCRRKALVPRHDGWL